MTGIAPKYNNMFEVLRQDDSDDESKPAKQTKHEQRKEDQGIYLFFVEKSFD